MWKKCNWGDIWILKTEKEPGPLSKSTMSMWNLEHLYTECKITQCQTELTSAFRTKEPVPQIKIEFWIQPTETQLAYLSIIYHLQAFDNFHKVLIAVAVWLLLISFVTSWFRCHWILMLNFLTHIQWIFIAMDMVLSYFLYVFCDNPGRRRSSLF